MKVILFVRISTPDQSLDRQVEELTDYAAMQNWDVVHVVREVGSGSTAVENRNAINELKSVAVSLRVNKVLVSEVSRIGRTTSESLGVIDFLTKNRISCVEYQRKIETLNEDLTVNPIAELILSVLASCAKLEKSQLILRIKSGMKSAASKGKHLGRPNGSVKTQDRFLQENKAVVSSLMSERLSVRKTAKLYNVSLATVMKVKKMIAA